MSSFAHCLRRTRFSFSMSKEFQTFSQSGAQSGRRALANTARRAVPICTTRQFSACARVFKDASIPNGIPASTISEASTPVTTEPSATEDPKMAIAFTCTVPDCGHRQAHVFSKRSYEKGIVIVTCSGCKNRHLIADHLGWFENLTGEGSHVTIEQLAKAKGVPLKKGKIGESEVLEFAGDEPSPTDKPSP